MHRPPRKPKGPAQKPGSAFGAPGYIRFSYATNEERIRDGLVALREALDHARR